MRSLLDNLNFMVLDGVIAPEEVARALPPCQFDRRAPRRAALAQTIHEDDGESLNQAVFAILHHGDKTLVAKPGYYAGMGDKTLEAALSRRFGVVATFQSNDCFENLLCHRDGAQVGSVSTMSVDPPGGLFGQDVPIDEEDCGGVMRALLARYVGSPWEEIFPRVGGTAEIWRFL